MRVALVGPELEENLALRYLHAALAQAGHEAAIFDFHKPQDIESLARRIADYAPQLVGLSMVFTARAGEFAELAGELRRAGYTGHVTAGGHFASFHAERLLADVPAIDSIVHGEGETPLVALTERLHALADVPGLTFRSAAAAPIHTAPRTAAPELDSLPWPTRTPPFFTYLGMPIANVLGSRGCFGHCTFCSIAAWHRKSGGPRFRLRAPECVADEMAWLHHRHGVRIFNFHDDNFFLAEEAGNLERISALKAALDARGVGRIGVQLKARPDSITPDCVAALVRLGVFRVFLGVETNAVAGLRTLGRGIRREQNHEALALLEAAGIHTTFNLLIFDPETTQADLDDNLDFLDSHAQFPANFARVEVYGGTPLEARLRAENRLVGTYWGQSYAIRDPRVQRAFEVFHEVFRPRCFDDDAVNLLAMRLDYLLHLLGHFHSRAAGGTLAARCRRAIEELNRHSVGLLREIRGYVAAADLRKDRRRALATLAARLSAEREAVDLRMRRRMERLLREIQSRASAQPPRTLSKRAAAAAAAMAAALAISGCRDAASTGPANPAANAPPGDSEPVWPITEPNPKIKKTPPPPGPGKHMYEMVAVPRPPQTGPASSTPPGTHMEEMVHVPAEPKFGPSSGKSSK